VSRALALASEVLGPSAQLASVLLVVLGVAVAADVLLATRPLVKRPMLALLAVVPASAVFVILAEASIFRRLWGYNRVYISGVFVPRRMPVEELLTSVTFAIVAAVVWNLVHRSTRAADSTGDADPKRVQLRPPGRSEMHTLPASSRRVRVAAGVAGALALFVAVLAAVRGFSDNPSGQSVRSRARWRLWRIENFFDYDLPDLTIFLAAVVIAIAVLNLVWLRTKVFTSRAGWAAIVAAGMVSVIVDGWTAKASSPIIFYAQDEFVTRFPGLNMPLEITLLRMALAALTVALLGRVTRGVNGRSGGAGPA
jgi:lycopene cyclase domain-containing protein